MAVGIPGSASHIAQVAVFRLSADESLDFYGMEEVGRAARSPESGFGKAVAIHGSTVFVGAPDQVRTVPYVVTPPGPGSRASADSVTSERELPEAGVVYRYERIGGNLRQLGQPLMSPTPAAYHRFGAELAFDGETLVVGTTSQDVEGGNGAFVFQRLGESDVLEFQIELQPEGFIDPSFGAAVAVDGDTIVVGAPFASGSGEAYVYTRAGDTWEQRLRLESPGNAQFGRAVAIERDLTLVGAPDGVDAPYVYRRSDGVWSTQHSVLPGARMTPESREEVDLGHAIDLSDGHAIVGGRFPFIY